jgi:hypothetical protein
VQRCAARVQRVLVLMLTALAKGSSAALLASMARKVARGMKWNACTSTCTQHINGLRYFASQLISVSEGIRQQMPWHM